MHSLELAREVEARWPELPVCSVSGYTEMQSDGSEDFLTDGRLLGKPFTPDDLTTFVSNALAAQRLRSSPG